VRNSTRFGKGTIRPLDPDDPRNPDHPCHREQWLELARALGRLAADMEWDRLHSDQGLKNDQTENSSGVRKVLKRHPKGQLD
jgi:hypothetical protein